MASAAAEKDLDRFYDLTTEFQIVLATGDIHRQNVDVMVNLVTSDFDITKGLWKQWKERDKLQAECRAKAPEALEDGEYVVTSGHDRIVANYIYHWACCVLESMEVNLELYLQALSESFEIANAMELRSIAIPVFNTHVFQLHEESRINDEKLASVICETFLKLSKTLQPLCTITLHLVMQGKHNAGLCQIYRDVLEQNKQCSSTTSNLSMNNSTTGSETNYGQSEGEHEPPSQIIIRDTPSSISQTTQNRAALPKYSGNEQRKQEASSKESFINKGARPKDIYTNIGATIGDQDDNKVPSNGQVDVHIYVGDLVQQKIDAIIHPTQYIGEYISLSGKVGKALKNAAGPAFVDRCQTFDTKLPEKVQKEIVETDAGDLPCKKVIHVNITGMNSQYDWAGLIWATLRRAEECRLSTIAFPAVGLASDSNEFKAVCFKQAIDQFKISKPVYLDKVYIVLQNHQTASTFRDVIFTTQAQTAILDQTRGDSSEQVFPGRGSNNAADIQTVTYRGIGVTVKDGDIGLENGDCIVHGVEAYSSGVGIPTRDDTGTMLLDKGGQTYQDTCYNKDLKKGEHVITPGGNLSCKNILHKDITDYRKKKNWGDFVKESLDIAEGYSMEIVTFPLLGVEGINVHQLSKTQMLAVELFINTSPTAVKEIRFVFYKHDIALKAFQACLKELEKNKSPPKQGSNGSRPTTSGTSSQRSRSPGNKQAPKSGNQSGGTITIKVREGDIAKSTCDMIVHGTRSSYSYIPLDDSIGKALDEVGGYHFRQACSKKSVQPGMITVTDKTGDLKCAKVLHIDLANMISSDNYEWTQKINQILLFAEAQGMTSIAFPPIGTYSKFRPTWKKMATIFKDTIDNLAHKRSPKHLKEVEIVIHRNTPLYQDFVDIIPQGAATGFNRLADHISVKQNDKSFSVEVAIGDLTKETTDAIVHATDSQWSFKNSRVGQAIVAAGGQGLVDSRNSARTKHKDKRPITIISRSGNLPCKQVIHVNLTHQASMDEKILTCLKEASSANVKSMSFPALGTGTRKGDVTAVAMDFKNAIQKFSSSVKQNKLVLIRIVIFEEYMKKQFLDVLKNI